MKTVNVISTNVNVSALRFEFKSCSQKYKVSFFGFFLLATREMREASELLIPNETLTVWQMLSEDPGARMWKPHLSSSIFFIYPSITHVKVHGQKQVQQNSIYHTSYTCTRGRVREERDFSLLYFHKNIFIDPDGE